MLRADRHLSETTRQRNLVIAVDAPLDQDPPLLPGTFLEAEIVGQNIDGLWDVPITAISQQGEIWRVTTDGALQSMTADVLFTNGTEAFVRPPEALRDTDQMVVVQPLNSYIDSMMVNPVREASHD